MVQKIEAFIYDSIPKENYPGRTDWLLNDKVQGLPRNKIETFQNN